MTTKQLLITSCLIVLSAVAVSAQLIEREIYFVHGIGGSNSSWENAWHATADGYYKPSENIAFPKRKARVYAEEYADFDESMQAASLALRTAINYKNNTADLPANYDYFENFVIAHSQGGLVTRKLDLEYDEPNPTFTRKVGGIVTFGTPHMGAQVLNDDKQPLRDLATETCNKLLQPQAAELQYNAAGSSPLAALLLRNFNTGAFVNDAVDAGCEFIDDFGINFLLSDLNAGISTEYGTDDTSPFIDEIETHSLTSTTHKVAFYGVEDDPVFWRMMNYMFLNVPNDLPPFEAESDQGMLDIYDDNKEAYLTRYYHFVDVTDELVQDGAPCTGWTAFGAGFGGFFLGAAIGSAWGPAGTLIGSVVIGIGATAGCGALNNAYYEELGHARNARWGYATAYDHIMDINSIWEHIIGGAETNDVEVYDCECCPQDQVIALPPDPDEPPSTPQGPTYVLNRCYMAYSGAANSNPAGCQAYNDSEYVCRQLSRLIPVTTLFPNDGVVPVSSAREYPGCDEDNKVLMPGSSHMQMRNDRNTYNGLLDVYEGEYGNYFITTGL